MLLGALGYANTDSDTWPIWLVAILQVPLWLGLIGAVIVVSRRWGTGQPPARLRLPVRGRST